MKLFWRLLEDAVRGALVAAQQLGVTATAHIDNGGVTHERALALGPRHFEHIHPIAGSVLCVEELDTAAGRAAALPGGPTRSAPSKPGALFQLILEQWRLLGAHEPRVTALIERLRTSWSALTPTLHIFAQRLGL